MDPATLRFFIFAHRTPGVPERGSANRSREIFSNAAASRERDREGPIRLLSTRTMEGLGAWIADPTATGNKEEGARRIVAALQSGTHELILDNLELNTLPPEIGQLTNLTHISLFNNHITTIPPEIERLPSCLLVFGVVVSIDHKPTLTINQHELETKPLEILHSLGNHLLADKGMPDILWRHPEENEAAEGLDFGGVKRQFVSLLTDNLFKPRSGFAYTDKLGGKLPVLTPLQNREPLRTLARLIEECASSPLLMGCHLPDNLYYALSSLSDADIEAMNLDKPLDQMVQRKINAALLGLEHLDEEDFVDESVILPIAIAAKELKPATLQQLRSDPRKFIDKVQGKEVTIETLKTHLIYDGDFNQLIEGYFNQFFEGHPDKLKDLVELFTSSRTLGEDLIRIKVLPSSNKLPTIHTCSQQVEIPRYSSYVQFLNKLMLSFSSLKRFDLI